MYRESRIVLVVLIIFMFLWSSVSQILDNKSKYDSKIRTINRYEYIFKFDDGSCKSFTFDEVNNEQPN